MTGDDNYLREVLEDLDEGILVEVFEKKDSVSLYKLILEDGKVEKDLIKSPRGLITFLKNNGEIIKHEWEDIEGRHIVIKLDPNLLEAYKLICRDPADQKVLRKGGFESVVKRHRKARELNGDILDLTSEDLRSMGLQKLESDLREIHEMIVTHANEIDCSVRAAAASLRMYKDEFDDCYTKLSKAIEKASKNVDSYERALDKVD